MGANTYFAIWRVNPKGSLSNNVSGPSQHRTSVLTSIHFLRSYEISVTSLDFQEKRGIVKTNRLALSTREC